MKQVLLIIFSILISTTFVFSAEENFQMAETAVQETYKLRGQIEYDDNPIETIYLDENIKKPQINIPNKSLTLPVGVLNITSNANSPRSALAKSVISRNKLNDILPLSGSITEQMGNFSYGQTWEQEISPFAQLQATTAFFVRYDTPKAFSFTTSVRQASNQDIGNQFNTVRFTPEWHITDKLTLKDSLTNYMDQSRNRNQVTLVYTPALKKYAESLKFELGIAQTYYRTGRQTSTFEFSTGFKL